MTVRNYIINHNILVLSKESKISMLIMFLKYAMLSYKRKITLKCIVLKENVGQLQELKEGYR